MSHRAPNPVETAEALIQAGKLAAAAAALSDIPEDMAPIRACLSAKIALRRGEPDLALEELAPWSEILAPMPQFHVLRADAYECIQDMDKAAAAWLAYAALDKNSAAPWVNAGRIYLLKGDKPKASDCLLHALKIEPDNSLAVFYTALLLEETAPERALSALRECVRLDPGLAEARYRLGLLLLKKEHYHDALPELQYASAVMPSFAQGHNCLGRVQLELGLFAEAVASLDKAVQLLPGEFAFRRDAATAQIQTGRALVAEGDFKAATEAFQVALTHAPDSAVAHVNLGLELLRVGEWAEGWREFAWRRYLPDAPAPFEESRRWAGQPVTGQKVLILTEQGMGDTIQFARFLPALKKLCSRVELVCPQPVARLLRDARVADAVHAGDTAPGEFDCWLRLLDLPMLLGTEPENVSGMPYIVPSSPPSHTRGPKTRPRGGVVWQGNPSHTNDAARSIPTTAIATLKDSVDFEWLSLQKNLAGDMPAPFPDLVAACADFADTRDTIASLDFMISVDTAMAHLAGAMGLPTVLLIPPVADWRWGSGAGPTIWYHSMRVVRRGFTEDWPSTLKRAVAAAQDLLASKPSSRRA